MRSAATATKRGFRYATRTAAVGNCAICRAAISAWDKVARTVKHRGRSATVCGTCRRRYVQPCRQIAASGFRFRFVERRELPTYRVPNHYAEVFKILTLLRERQILRQKEVKWMVGEKTKQILTLYERIGRVLLETFEVRGDEFTRPDNVAISMIRDLIEEIDPKVIDKLVRERTRKRTKRERLP